MKYYWWDLTCIWGAKIYKHIKINSGARLKYLLAKEGLSCGHSSTPHFHVGPGLVIKSCVQKILLESIKHADYQD